jgi:putative phage-type endonuclease
MSALIQQSDEWLQIRKTKIGASEASIILGLSPWKTPYQLWEEKLGLRTDSPKTHAMQRGIELEEKARRAFEDLTGLIVFPEVVFHPEHDWMMASLDGIDLALQNIVEIKCPGKEDHEIAKSGNIPDKYYPQLQHQMACTGLKSAYYFSYNGSQGIILRVERSDAYISNMIKAEKRFYDQMMTFEPPELTERDYITKDDDIWSMTAHEYLKTKRVIADLEKRERELKQSLICMSGRSNAKGAGIRLSKIVRMGNVNYAAIPELENVNLNLYRKQPIETWRVIAE